jgi:hypothetical protein
MRLIGNRFFALESHGLDLACNPAEISPWLSGCGWRMVRPVTELEVRQDSLDDAGRVGEAYDPQQAGAATAQKSLTGYLFLIRRARVRLLGRARMGKPLFPILACLDFNSRP